MGNAKAGRLAGILPGMSTSPEERLSQARTALREWRRAVATDDPIVQHTAAMDMERALKTLLQLLT